MCGRQEMTSAPASDLAVHERAVGVMLPRDLPAGEVLDVGRRAQEIGLDELWVVEDLGLRGGIAQPAAVLASIRQVASSSREAFAAAMPDAVVHILSGPDPRAALGGLSGLVAPRS